MLIADAQGGDVDERELQAWLTLDDDDADATAPPGPPEPEPARPPRPGRAWRLVLLAVLPWVVTAVVVVRGAGSGPGHAGTAAPPDTGDAPVAAAAAPPAEVPVAAAAAPPAEPPDAAAPPGSTPAGEAGAGHAGAGVAGAGVAGSGVAGSGVAGSGVAGLGVGGADETAAAAAAAVVAALTSLEPEGGDPPRLVQWAAAERIEEVPALAVVTVRAVVFERAGDRWRVAAPSRWGVAVSRARPPVVIGGPWALAPPPAAGPAQAWEAVSDPDVLRDVAAAAVSAGYRDVLVERVEASAGLAHVLRAALDAVAPDGGSSGAGDRRRHDLWLTTSPGVAVLGAAPVEGREDQR